MRAPKNGREMSSGKHPNTQTVVLDAEPILIWADGDPGSTTVNNHLTDTYFNHIQTYISHVNLTEVYYNCAKRGGHGYGKKKTGQLRNFGVQFVESSSTWEQAAEFKDAYTPNFPLADAYALATAVVQAVPLLAGDDRHWDDPEDDGYDIIRVP